MWSGMVGDGTAIVDDGGNGVVASRWRWRGGRRKGDGMGADAGGTWRGALER